MVAGAAACVAVLAPAASARLSPAVTLDGPSADILEVGGSALASDGTGGVVYRKVQDGRAHIFAVKFSRGAWGRPQRVDARQAFDSSWPRVAAGRGGQLLVTWVQEFGPGTDRLFSAISDGGAERFESPASVDFNVGEATGTQPTLAMSPVGEAYVTYRVITDDLVNCPTCPDGYVKGEFRIARFRGRTWSRLGVINRNRDQLIRAPNAGNAPKIGIDVESNGVVAWQEPDDGFVDRIWARRVFGANTGIPLLASPRSFGGRPVNGSADSFALDNSGFGVGGVAYRQQPDSGSALRTPRVLYNWLPERFQEKAADFRGAVTVGDGGAPQAAPSVSVAPDSNVLLGYDQGADTRLVTGFENFLDPSQRIDSGRQAAGDPQVEIGSTGNAMAAWRFQRGSESGVTIEERPLRGSIRRGRVAARIGGPIADLDVGGSGLGDGLVAFRQGGSTTGQVAASIVDAGPAKFVLDAPLDFVKPSGARLNWNAAEDALGGVGYAVEADGVALARGLGGLSYRIPRDGLEDGVYDVRIRATDRVGNENFSPTETLKIDSTGPRVRLIRRRGRKLSVRVSDGRRGRVAGVRRVRVSWGDRTRQGRRSRSSHRYRKRGRYRVAVLMHDEAGNRRKIVKRVRIRR